MEPLKESNRLGLYPTLQFKDRSPPKPSSPSRFMLKQESDFLAKPPGRISPFKGKKAHMSNIELFSTTPKRIFTTKTQSVDRNGFGHLTADVPPPTESEKSEITFEMLKGMAPSNLRTISQTPSRMISGRKRQLPSSEQPASRLIRPTVSSALKSNEPSANLLDQFKSQKSILKRKLSPTLESEESSDDTDMTTTLNTMKNTGNAKNVIKLLQSAEPEADQQPRKKRAVTFASGGKEAQITNEKIMETLMIVLQNQDKILQKLSKLEHK